MLDHSFFKFCSDCFRHCRSQVLYYEVSQRPIYSLADLEREVSENTIRLPPLLLRTIYFVSSEPTITFGSGSTYFLMKKTGPPLVIRNSAAYVTEKYLLSIFPRILYFALKE